MGKQSSAKKVNRAARAGGSASSGSRRKLGFPAAVAAVLLVGVALVVFAVFQKSGNSVSPALDDHWHAAEAIWICDSFYDTPLADVQGDQFGIHTHSDGLIHIHPFTSNVTGEKATMGVFADDVGIEFGDDSFTLPDGTTYTNGDDCQGEAGEVAVLKWSAGNLDGEPEVISSDFADVRFTANGEAFTIAFMKPDQDLAALLPPSVSNINNPSDLEPGETVQPAEVPADASADTVAPEGAGATAETSPTTAAPGDTTSSAGGEAPSATGP